MTFRVYRDQLALSERHLQGLLENTTSALDLLAALSDSFKAVETHTAAFQAQCEDLLTEKELLKRLGDEVSEGLKFYSFLEPITRRLNSPGASRAIGDDSFVEILGNLDSCIDYMTSHVCFFAALYYCEDTLVAIYWPEEFYADCHGSRLNENQRFTLRDIDHC